MGLFSAIFGPAPTEDPTLKRRLQDKGVVDIKGKAVIDPEAVKKQREFQNTAEAKRGKMAIQRQISIAAGEEEKALAKQQEGFRLAKEVTIAPGATRLGLGLFQSIKESFTGKEPEAIKSKGKLVSAFLAPSEDFKGVKSFPTQIKEIQETADTKTGGLFKSAVLFPLLAVADILPGGGGKKKVVKELLEKAGKESLDSTVKKTAVKFADVPPPKIDDMLPEASKLPLEDVTFDLKPETRLELFRRNIQDKTNRISSVQRDILAAGREIPESSDVALKQTLYIGRAKDALDTFDNTVVDPILKRVSKEGFTLDEVGEYMYAKHAPERNAQMALNNSKLKTGSGMTDDEAMAIIKKYEDSGRARQMESIAQDVYDTVTAGRLRLLEESGLESKETIEALRIAYKNYIPLKGKEGIESRGIPRGQGFSLTGKDVRRAFGRESKAKFNPVVQAIADYQDTLVRVEKNKVAQTLKKLVEENPNQNLWKLESVKYTPRFDEAGEVISMDRRFIPADNIVEVKENGKSYLITIKDQPLVDALKGFGQARGLKLLSNVNNYLRAVNTVLSPEFVLSNFSRDLQTASINLSGEQSAKIAAKVIKDVPKAMRGIYKNVRSGDMSNEWAALYKEAKENGMKIGFLDQKTIEERTSDLVRKVESYNKNRTTQKLKDAVESIGDYVSDINEVVESSIRLSAYKTMKETVSPERAAALAKNLTVDFNKKGNLGVALNSMYLFANAGIQGSFRIFSALKSPRVQKIVAGIGAASYGLAEVNRMINEEEYDKLDDSLKNSNMIFMLPDGNHIKIPLPYGYNVFWAAGEMASEQVHKKKTAGESIVRLVDAVDQAFNPLSSGSLLQSVSPTALDPIVQLSENKNWFGGPIRPEQPQFGAAKRDSALYWPSVRKPSLAVTEWLNKNTGGTTVKSGVIDISPEAIDHFVDTLTGSLGKFVANLVETGASVSKGELPEADNTPFLRKFYGKPSEYQPSKVIRETLLDSGRKEFSEIELNRFKQAVRDQIENGKMSKEEAVKTIKEFTKNQGSVEISELFDRIASTPMSERKQFAEEISNLSTSEKEQLVKLIKKQAELDQRLQEAK